MGAIAGFFIGGILGHAIGTSLSHSVDDGMLGGIGTIIGLVFGFAITWYVVGRIKRP